MRIEDFLRIKSFVLEDTKSSYWVHWK